MTIETKARDTSALSRPLAWLWGVATAAAAVGVGEVVAAFAAPGAAPVAAVGDAVIRLSPQPVVDWAKHVLSTADKPVLQVGILVLLAVIAAALGSVSRRHWLVALAGLGVFTAIGVAAALARANPSVLSAVPALAGGLAAGAVWWLLPRFAGLRPAAKDVDDPRLFQRRRFVLAASTVIGVAGVGGFAARTWAQGAIVSQARDKIKLPAPADPAFALPPDSELAVKGLTPWRTPNSKFYRIDTALTVPAVEPKNYRLRIFGRVERELTLTYQDLLDRPLRERDITLACVSNEVGGNLIGNARWLGVPLSELLDEVGPDPAADQLLGRSSDGFTAGSPTQLVRDGRDSMLAIGMNGAPLPLKHGFPVRMIVPGLYGYVSATKWLTELELTTFDAADAYWVPRGWSAFGPIKTQSRIDTPHGNAKAGRVAVAGVAWAQHRGIGAVEVRVDDGPWHEASLSAVASTDTWRQWVWHWDASPGDHTLTVRATDEDGDTQPQKQSPVAPNGATGWHSVKVTVK